MHRGAQHQSQGFSYGKFDHVLLLCLTFCTRVQQGSSELPFEPCHTIRYSPGVTDTYERFEQDVARCFSCPLSKTRIQVVIDRGNPEADIAIVGEAPGKNEDETGLVFTGKAGYELDEILEEGGLDPQEDVGMFNILKCRPPDNEFPTPSIVKQCLPHLDRQIALMNRKVIIMTGKNAALYTVWRSHGQAPPMGDLHGRWIMSQKYPLIDFLAMYHTAWLLREEEHDPKNYRKQREIAIDVVEWAADLLKGEQPPLEPLVVGARHYIERRRKRAR